jgi:hypothetical protein
MPQCFGPGFGDGLAVLALKEALDALLLASALADEAAPQRIHQVDDLAGIPFLSGSAVVIF